MVSEAAGILLIVLYLRPNGRLSSCEGGKDRPARGAVEIVAVSGKRGRCAPSGPAEGTVGEDG